MSETSEAEKLLEEFAALDRASAEENLDRFVDDLRQALASLGQRQEELETGRQHYYDIWFKAEDENIALRTQLRQAEDKLRFYGDPATYKGLIADNESLTAQLRQAETALRDQDKRFREVIRRAADLLPNDGDQGRTEYVRQDLLRALAPPPTCPTCGSDRDHPKDFPDTALGRGGAGGQMITGCSDPFHAAPDPEERQTEVTA